MTKSTGFLGALLLSLGAPLAHADFLISYQIGSGSIVTCTHTASSPNSSGLCMPNIFSAIAGFGSQVGTSATDLLVGLIDNTGRSTETFKIWLADQNFTSPTTPPKLVDSATVMSSGPVTVVSCIDTSNGTAPPLGTFCSSAAGMKLSGTDSQLISSLKSPYSLSQVVTFSLSAGSELSFIAEQTVTPVPEPASLILLGSGLLGATILVRKRMQSKRAQGVA
jgi:hypothetical protein